MQNYCKVTHEGLREKVFRSSLEEVCGGQKYMDNEDAPDIMDNIDSRRVLHYAYMYGGGGSAVYDGNLPESDNFLVEGQQ